MANRLRIGMMEHLKCYPGDGERITRWCCIRLTGCGVAGTGKTIESVSFKSLRSSVDCIMQCSTAFGTRRPYCIEFNKRCTYSPPPYFDTQWYVSSCVRYSLSCSRHQFLQPVGTQYISMTAERPKLHINPVRRMTSNFTLFGTTLAFVLTLGRTGRRDCPPIMPDSSPLCLSNFGLSTPTTMT